MSRIQNTTEKTRKLNRLFKLKKQSQLSTINCFLWNARSLNNKVNVLLQFLEDNQTDIVCITETWFSEENSTITFSIKEAGWEIEHTYRSKRGGGVCILWKPHINVKCSFKRKSYDTFQYVNILLNGTIKINFICIYRLQETSISLFMNELDDMLSYYSNNSDTIVLTGDFNFHFENTHSKNNIDLANITSSYGLSQFVVGPSHKLGHTLDLVFANKYEFDLPFMSPLDIDLSDHFPILFKLPSYSKPCTPASKIIKYRKIKSIDRNEFSRNLCTSLNSRFEGIDKDTLPFEDHQQMFVDCAIEQLDIAAPLKTTRQTSVSQPPWMDAEYREERALRRRLERTWKSSGLQEDKTIYLLQCKKCSRLVTLKREKYYSDLISKCEGDNRALFKIVNTVMDKRKSAGKLPLFDKSETLANQFNHFYSNKVKQIRNKIISSSTNKKDFRKSFEGVPMEFLEPTTVEELREVIKDMGIKTSGQDPLPGSLCKDIIDDLLPYFAELVNKSMSTGSVEGIKDSVIIPLLKKSGIDPDLLKNYRPVTNEVYISKLTEKLVAKRLFKHMNINELHSKFQHGYKPFHGTETLLLKLVDDVLIGFDSNSATILLLIDLSAAFDTVDIDLLLDILEKDIGIKGTALKWFRSFLTGRTQRVQIENSLSDILPVLFGVPQGSVLGPVLFNIYSSSLSYAINSFGFNTSGYADDNNAYQTFALSFQLNIISQQLPKLLDLINDWMNLFFLKMNPDKTEIIMLLPQQLKDVHTINGCIFSDNSCIRFSEFVKNLGYTLDKHLNMDIQVNNVVSHCYKLISDIGKVRRFLSDKHTKLLVQSLISSRLDYCNSLYYGINKSEINKLQKIQNAAARLVCKRKKYESISDYLKELHWLRVEARIIFKVLVLVYKCLHDMAPQCIISLIDTRDDDNYLLVLRNFQSNHARKSFSYNAPRLWNNLPDNIRQSPTISKFKSQTKYLLFNNFSKYIKSVYKYN